MIIEDKKETCHPACRIDLRIAVSHKFVGLHPTYKYPCHSERRIDLRVSESHVKVDRQHKEEIPEQVRNDMKGRHCERSAAIQNNSTLTPHPNPQLYSTQSHTAHKFAGSASVPQWAREQSYEIPKRVRDDMKGKFLVP